jgi:hypothetical protein
MIDLNTLMTFAKSLGWSELSPPTDLSDVSPSYPSDFSDLSTTDASSFSSSEDTGLRIFYPTPETLVFGENAINVVKLGMSWWVSKPSSLSSFEVIQFTGMSIPPLTHAPTAQYPQMRLISTSLIRMQGTLQHF